MKPLLHANISAKKFGGKPEDYIDIHNWFDQIKAHIADARHRVLLHNSFGIYLCEQVFGDIIQTKDGFKRMPYITNSIGDKVPVRDIAERHVLDDMGSIPSLVDVLNKMTIHEDLIGGKQTKRVVIDPKNIVIVD